MAYLNEMAEGGEITLPAELLQAMNIAEGDVIDMERQGNALVLTLGARKTEAVSPPQEQ